MQIRNFLADPRVLYMNAPLVSRAFLTINSDLILSQSHFLLVNTQQ
jgi:hypothetical protein